MLDTDLAALYGVEAKVLNQAVKRNADRFPADFMFQLTHEEAAALRSQFVTLDDLPYAFTEQGVATLSSVLKSRRANQVNLEIKRAFVRLRDMVGHHRELARRLDALESKYDRPFKVRAGFQSIELN
jgi:hypothetical protein